MSEDHDQCSEEVAPHPSRKKLRSLGVAAAGIALVIAALGILSRDEHAKAVATWTDEAAIPTVSIVHPQQETAGQEIVLPSNVRAWYSAPVYARVSGYLTAWYFDYGARVKKGQVLAEIDAPDLDAQFTAAKARLKSAEAVVKVRDAEARFADTTFARWHDSPKGVVSVQEMQSKQADNESAIARLSAARADVAVAQAEVDRLQALEGFKRVTAPFDGIVTARETDIGALINAGSGVGGGSGPELFRVADVHKMRVYVKVPQRMASSISAGMKAQLHLPQYPDRTFDATVTNTSSAINVTSRTLRVEMHAENPDGLLQPGTFAEVHWNAPINRNLVQIPASALLFRQDGLEVAVVGPDDKIALRHITLGRNLDAEVEVLQGLSPSDSVVDSPPDALASGDLVRIAAKSTADEKTAAR
jgi:membrane fusion protein, multidrug efflux system